MGAADTRQTSNGKGSAHRRVGERVPSGGGCETTRGRPFEKGVFGRDVCVSAAEHKYKYISSLMECFFEKWDNLFKRLECWLTDSIGWQFSKRDKQLMGFRLTGEWFSGKVATEWTYLTLELGLFISFMSIKVAESWEFSFLKWRFFINSLKWLF